MIGGILMNKNDRAKLEKILKLNEYQLHAYLIKYLNQKYKKYYDGF